MARGKSDESQAAAMRLVGIAQERYTFLTSQTGEPFAVPNGGPQVARLLRGGKHSLRAELSYLYVVEHQAVPSQQALADAALTLEGRAGVATGRAAACPGRVRRWRDLRRSGR